MRTAAEGVWRGSIRQTSFHGLRVRFVPGSSRQVRWLWRPAAILERCWWRRGAWFAACRPCHCDVRSWGTDRGRWPWSCRRTPWRWCLARPAPAYTGRIPGSTASCKRTFAV